MKVKYCERCGMQINWEYHFHMTYSGCNEADLCEECADKFKQWLNCEDIEDRLEKVADRLEKMVGDDDVCKG
jgi:hypothetical protein